MDKLHGLHGITAYAPFWWQFWCQDRIVELMIWPSWIPHWLPPCQLEEMVSPEKHSSNNPQWTLWFVLMLILKLLFFVFKHLTTLAKINHQLDADQPRLRSISFPWQRNEWRNTAICWNHRSCSPSMKWLMVWLMHSHKEFSSLHGPDLQHSSLQLAVEFAPPWGNKKGCEQIRKRSSSICKRSFWWFFWSWCDDFPVVFWPVSTGPRTWLLRACLGLWNPAWGNTWNS